VEDIDGEDKLGQPMVQFSWIRPKGVLDLFLLPGFRERTFPGSSGRLRGALPVAVGSPVYLGDASEGHVDFAARWAQSVGPVDIGISCFYGVGRDPLFQPGELDGVPVLQPVYSLVHQGGLDIQYTGGNVLLKLEAIARSGPGQRIEAFVAGFEYTFYGLAGTNIDLGVLSEMHYDSRGVFSGHPLNDDIFSGFRAAFNDEKDTSVLAGMFYDLDNHSTSFRLEFERRIGSRMKLEIDFQKFGATDPMDPLRDLRNDSYLQIGLRRYF